MQDLTGKSLRGYEIQERIGEGGFGVVYRAHQPAVKRDVVIKAILPVYANNPDFIRNFEAEAQLIARLEHLHIVPLYDYWRGPEGAFLVMRWLRGGSLLDSLKRGPWPVDTAARLLDQIASALTIAHRNNIIHQDIKPANILLDEEQNAYLTDFGLAKDLVDGIDLSVSTVGASVRGSPAYISPEQIKRIDISPQTDLYSLGIVLYELLSGEHPYGMGNIVELLRHQLNSQLPIIQQRRPDLPDKLNLVLWKATAKDPAVRYLSAIEMAAAFREAIAAYKPDKPVTPDRIAHSRTNGEVITDIISLESIDMLLHGPPNPFKGLRAFQEADAQDFFGRDALIETLLQRLSQDEYGSRFLAVVGPSGSGKSSVVKAGLIPAIRKGRITPWQRWFIVEMTPASQPLNELNNALAKVATQAAESIQDQLHQEDGLNRAINAALPPNDTELILVIDQFEEVFTQTTDERHRAHFLRLLFRGVTAADSRLRLIITLRADFYDRPLLYAGFGELMRQRTEIVLPMSAEELSAAVSGPAQRVGLVLDDGLVDRIVDSVIEQPGSLPLLQFTLSELYERRKKDRLTLKAYDAIGGVSGALAGRADELYDQLSPAQQTIAQQMFLRLVTPGEGAEDTRRRALQSELLSLAPDENDVLYVMETFGKHRLFTFDHDPTTRTPTVEIAHEALIRSWGTLRLWLDQNRSDLRLQRQLAAAATDWLVANRDASFLATGARLAQFEALADAPVALNTTERAYLEASIKQRRRQQQKGNIILSVLVIVAATFLLVALAAIDQRNQAAAASEMALAAQATAVAERDRADQEALVARSRELAASALIAADRIDLSLLLSLEALHAADTFEARSTLLALLQQHPSLSQVMSGHTDWIRSLAYSPDGTYLASASRDGSVHVWSADTYTLIGEPMLEHQAWVNTVAFSSDSRWLGSGDNDGTIILWNLEDHTTRRLTAHADAVWSLAFHPNAPLLVSAGADGTLRLWDTTSGEQIATRAAHNDIVYAVAYSPDGQMLASASADNTIRLWNADNLELLRELPGHSNWVFSIAYSPDGQMLASASADNTIRLWDLNAATSRILAGHENWVRALAFLPDGQRLISGGADGLILVWDTATSRPVTGFTSVGRSAIWSLAVQADGRQFISGGASPALYLWDLTPDPALATVLDIRPEQILAVAVNPDSTLLASAGGLRTDFSIRLSDENGTSTTLNGHQGQVTSLAFSPTLPRLASGSLDRQVIIWDTANRETLGTLQADDSVFALAHHPSGNQIAVGDNSGAITLWDVAGTPGTWQPLTSLSGHQDRVLALAYSPDGHTLASGSRDGTILFWDTETGQPLGPPATDHTDGILSLAFSRDGQMLASASRDTTIRLWTRTGDTWQASGEPLLGHKNWVVDIEFSPDGQMLASASGDHTILLWHIPQRTALGSAFRGHTDWVNSLAFSPKGDTLYSGGRDGRLIAWQTGLNLWQARACQIANRNLTPDEQQRYFPGTIAAHTICPPFNQEAG